ncbi:DUF1304 domain-containing protein [Pantanalinema sp. GBBB05]|uniref:DUF1304 domain-containing protein n=1 Tax=Pantanalinema sp. GBBB05 TaxID=2604139 RepID=UPI001DFA370C|nr:DUF1304 domain-containing protein [Pantanalinema sp. GBBB05]
MAIFANELIPNILICIVAIIHLWFLILEMLLWRQPVVQKQLEKLKQDHTWSNEELMARLAANQGFSNGILMAGLIWGLLATQASFAIKVFFLVSIICAGLLGGLTVKRSIWLFQLLPAMLALVALWLNHRA